MAGSFRSRLTVFVGRITRKFSRLYGGGTAFPGLVVEKIDPSFMTRTLATLPKGIVLVSGTNGKTTTTKIIVELLRAQGLKVFTNPTGSNFTRGVVAALLTEVESSGNLNADIAVLELDEAYAVHFVQKCKPRASLFLNVMRDQLDRFGEIDYTASLLHKVAEATTDIVVVNADDPRLTSSKFTTNISAKIVSFGVSSNLHSLFLSDDDLRRGHKVLATNKCLLPDVILKEISGRQAKINVADQDHVLNFSISGIHNILNATAALALSSAIMGKDAIQPKLFHALETVKPAFGRGEIVNIAGYDCELVLVKNPAGFRMGLLSFDPTAHQIMIAINDKYADGRDMSWLWDVDFTRLQKEVVTCVTGSRAWDMALRLDYDLVKVHEVIPDLAEAIKYLIAAAKKNHQPILIFCTYTAMLAIRKELAKITHVEEALK